MNCVVAGGLMDASNKTAEKSDEEATRINQNMESKSDAIIERWEVPLFLISLPAKPIMTPVLKGMRKNQINKVAAKEITRDQFKTRGLITDYASNLINSLSLGFLVYIVLRIFKRYNR